MCHRALVFDRGRVVAELGDADLAVENLLAASPRASGMARDVTFRRVPVQSLKSNALEPTRSELAALSRWQAIGRLLLRPAWPAS